MKNRQLAVVARATEENPEVLDPHKREEVDQAYADGIADLAEKILGLIYATDGEIRVSELAEFIDHERNHTASKEMKQGK
jgi:hypothetical protein